MTIQSPEPLVPPQNVEQVGPMAVDQRFSFPDDTQQDLSGTDLKREGRVADDQGTVAAESPSPDRMAEVSTGSAQDPVAEPEPFGEALLQTSSVSDAGTLDLLRNEVIPALKAFSSRTDFYEDLVRRLQQRIETLQSDQIQELLSPVFQRLAILLTKATDSAERARRHDGDYQADVEFDHFADLVVEALALVNVDQVGAAVGMPFNRTLHAARKAVSTGDQSLDGTVAKVLRQGLIREGAERAFLPAQVTVYRYSAQAVASSGPAATIEVVEPTAPHSSSSQPSTN